MSSAPAAPREQVFEPLIGAAEAATLLGVPRSWIYANAEAGAIPSFKLGPKYRRFRVSELRAWLEAQRGDGSGAR